MHGLAPNGNLLSVGTTFEREVTTVPGYRLWSIADRHPAMLRVSRGGAASAVEGHPETRVRQVVFKPRRSIGASNRS